MVKYPHINAEKGAVTEWSLGGGVALYSGWNPIINALNPANTFV